MSCADAGNRFRPEDKQNYTLLLKEMRKRFDHETKKLHRRLFITIATGAVILRTKALTLLMLTLAITSIVFEAASGTPPNVPKAPLKTHS